MRACRFRFRGFAGFTIVELMVVIAVISIIIAISLPNYSRSREEARASVCASNVRQLAICYRAYADEYQALFPYFGSRIYMPQMLKYHNDPQVRFCPLASKRYPDGGAWGSAKHAWGYGSHEGSYAVNGFLYNARGGDVGNEGGRGYFPIYQYPNWWWGRRMEDVRRQDITPAFADSNWVDTWPTPGEPAPPYFNGRYTGNNYIEMPRVAIDRHAMTVNVAFVDTSTRRVALGELWQLHWYKGWAPPVTPVVIP